MTTKTNVATIDTFRGYTKGEEIFNAITHGAGVIIGVIILIIGCSRSVLNNTPLGITGTIIFGSCMIFTYTISTVYHSLKPSKGKRVLQVLDHCAIYFLIIGTYLGIVLTGVLPIYPSLAFIIIGIEVVVGALAITLTAVNMKRFAIFSMVCYIVLGWCIVCISHIVIETISIKGFLWLLSGGIAYTVGSILYGLGRKTKYAHSVFHIFCLIGSLMHFICFAAYCL